MASFFVLVCTCIATLGKCGEWDKPLLRGAKIAPEELFQMGKETAASSVKAYAPTQANVIAVLAEDAGAPRACPKCNAKDYSDSCPLGWTELYDGSCRAPATYASICNTTQTFLSASVHEKIEVELQCDLCWPCTESDDNKAMCTRSYALPCPQGYSPLDINYNEYAEANGITCSADIFYEGQCEQRVQFKDTTSKIEFAERCQTSWPCETQCDRQLGLCPVGWDNIGDGLCMAPESYKMHGCSLLNNFRGWTNLMKLSFSRKCSVAWHCPENDVDDLDTCELDFSHCPRHWIQEGTMCAPPPDLIGVCAKPTDTKSLSNEQKAQWGIDCGLEWGCVGDMQETSSDVEEPRLSINVETSESGPVDYSGRIANA